MSNWNKTKIVATLGPASARRGVLRKMIQAGADIFRINGAHGTAEEHNRTAALVRDVAKGLKTSVAILVDLPGPKFRIGKLKSEPVFLKAGGTVELFCMEGVQRGDEIPVPHSIHANLKPGSRIFVNDGIVALSVLKVEGKKVLCRVKAGGEIRSNKGINLPGTKLSAPALTAKDKRVLDTAIRIGADYVGLSFVRSRSNISSLRRTLMRRAPHVGIVAKIEKPVRE